MNKYLVEIIQIQKESDKNIELLRRCLLPPSEFYCEYSKIIAIRSEQISEIINKMPKNKITKSPDNIILKSITGVEVRLLADGMNDILSDGLVIKFN